MAVFDCTNIWLKKYDTGEKVSTLQTELRKLGYYTGKVDGSYGYYTEQAVIHFQSAYGLSKDGKFGSESCKKLNSIVDSRNTNSTTTTSTVNTNTQVLSLNCPNIKLKYGSKGEQVRTLQTMLKALGYYNRQVDGEFYTYTERAVKDFQQKTRHSRDGVFGPKTCPDLNSEYAKKVGATSTSSSSSSSSSSSQSTMQTTVTPEYLRQVDASLTVLPEVVVLPNVEFDGSTNTKTVTGGSIDSDTNFNCSTVSLKRGSNGEDVKKLQTILKARGYYTRQVDGDFGEYTEKAVRKLQSAQGNDPDGWFGPKTCNKLQGTSTTSNNATATADKKNTKYTINKFISINTNDDAEGLSHEVTLKTVYSNDLMGKIRKLQKSQFDMYLGDDAVYHHEGYINDIKVTNEDSNFFIEISLVGYVAFLDQQVEYEKTAKRSELLKELIEMAGLKANIDVSQLTDDEFTIKVEKASSSSAGSGGSGLTQLSGNDCTDTWSLSSFSFDIDKCGGNTKIGNSSANYATDTSSMTAKEVIQDLFKRFKYPARGYDDNRVCPRSVWKKTGTISVNCADISRLVKCMGEVHGLKVGIHHCTGSKGGHYYNLIEVNGKVYRFDCCFGSSGYCSGYGDEVCNNLTKRGGPWSL